MGRPPRPPVRPNRRPVQRPPVKHRSRFVRTLLAIVQPRVLLPTVLGLGMLVVLLWVSGFKQAIHDITGFKAGYLVLFFVTMFGYEALRCAQWVYLLRSVGIRVPLRTQVYTYAVGEATKNLPVGNFIPDYALQRAQGTDFGRASSVTLLITLIEVGVSLLGIVLIGIPGWLWIRPLIVIGSAVFAFLVWTFYGIYHYTHAVHPTHPRHSSKRSQWLRRPLRWRWTRVALHELREFVRGERALMQPHIVGMGALFAAAYLCLSGIGLWAVLAGLGLSGVAWYYAMAINFVSLAFASIIPLPMDLGSTEASGAGALVAMGVAVSGAVSAMLLFRFFNLVGQVIVAGLALVIFPGETRALLSSRQDGQGRAGRAEQVQQRQSA